MQRSKEFALWCAIELCAILGGHDEKSLVQDVACFVTDRKLMCATLDDIAHQVKWATGAMLYAKYRDNLSQIKSVQHIKALQRKLWFYYVVLLHYRTIEFAELQKNIAKKFNEEQSIDGGLTDKEFLLFDLMDRRIKDVNTIREAGPMLERMQDLFHNAFVAMKNACDNLGFDYLPELYGEYETKQFNEANDTNKKSVIPQEASSEIDALHSSSNERKAEDKIAQIEKAKSLMQKTERVFRDTISVLERDKHNLEVKLSHAKNDIVRNILLSLTDYDYGSPLNELYLAMKDSETPEKVRGIINNLFLAFGNEGIKVVKEKHIGEIMVLNEDNQKVFDPIKNETIFLGDEVEICYPGYRFGGEIMIRPIVRKIKEIK